MTAQVRSSGRRRSEPLRRSLSLLLLPLLLAAGGAAALEYRMRSLEPTSVDGLTADAGVTAGHFDGDRRVDMALCFRRLYINLYSQNAAGEQVLRRQEKLWQVTDPSSSGVPFQIRQCRMHVLDLDANGIDDLVVTHSLGTLVLKLFPDGSVVRQEYARTGGGFVSGDGFFDSVVADLDGDGDMDLLGIRESGLVVSRFTNEGGGQFSAPVDVAWINSPDERGFRIAAGDLDGDGFVDLAVSMMGQHGASTALLHNDGRGWLLERSSTRIRHPAGYEFTQIEVGDVTGDGKDDLVMVNSGNSPKSVLLVYEQGGDGTLKAHVAYSAYQVPGSIAIQDLDGDGRNDIMLLHPSWTAITTYLQRSDGFLDIHGIVRQVYSPRNDYNTLSLRDFRNDGCKDVLIATAEYSWADGTGCLPASNADVATSVRVTDGSTSLQVENRDPANPAFAVVATLRLEGTGAATFYPAAPDGCTVSAANVKARVYVCRIARLEPGEIRTIVLPYTRKEATRGRYAFAAVARASSHGDDPLLANNVDRGDFWRITRNPVAKIAPPPKPPAMLQPRPGQRPLPSGRAAPGTVPRVRRASH